jgi:cholesterol oxidase
MSKSEYDAIVIGSGFGGAVSACRLAQANKKVLIIERGPRYSETGNPFPTVSFSMLNLLSAVTGQGAFPDLAGLLWNPYRGLFDVKVQRTMMAIQAAGYGGGSLVYANVHVQPPESTFDSGWPTAINLTSMKSYYDLVAYMLNLAPIPANNLPPKTKAMKTAANDLHRGGQFFYPNLAINFDQPADDFQRAHRAPNKCDYGACCITGCKREAKNSLDFNYLKVAEQDYHATVLTDSQVTCIEQLPGGSYKVAYTNVAAKFGAHSAPGDTGEATAPHVFLCAGAWSSTELLLRCRDEFETLRDLSPHLGRKFSGNGDYLAFAFNTASKIVPDNGPTITSAIVYDRKIFGERIWFLLEDGGYPQGLSGLVGLLNPRLGRDKIDGVKRQAGAVLKTLWPSVRLPAMPPTSSLDPAQTMVFLLMGRDRGDGTMRLTPKAPQAWIDWPVNENLPLYDVEQELALQFASALGGDVATNPLWKLFRLPVSVHNLGGCAMAEHEGDGVVDEFGNVFGYKGLHVLDGSIVPRALGVNPSHTIAALAERAIEHTIREMLGKEDWKAPEMCAAAKASTASADPIAAALPKSQTAKPEDAGEVTITFSELLRGDNFNGSGKLAELQVDITTPLLDEFLIDPEHRCDMRGKFRADGFTSVSGAEIKNGVFKLFVPSTAEQFYAREMRYLFDFVGNGGQTYSFVGIKYLRDAKPNSGVTDWLEGAWKSLTILNGIKDLRDAKEKSGVSDWLKGAWRSLTILNATITIDPNNKVTGELSLSWDQLLKQLSTFQVTGVRNPVAKARQLERFGRLFFGTAFDLYVRDRLHVKGG